MVARPDRELTNALMTMRTVETAVSVALWRTVKDGNADGECQHSAAGEDSIGVVTAMGGNTGVTAGAAGDRVQITHLVGPIIIPVLVGTGGATRGIRAQTVADGVTDVTPVAAGTTLVWSHGWFTESGVAGDIVGMIPSVSWVNEA